MCRGFSVGSLGVLLLGAVLSALPADPPSRAGEVTALLPVARVERGGAPPVEATLHDAVFWRDWFETEPRGRARLTLLDGSILNVGSAARLQVVQHDPTSQITDLELQLGKIRTQVKKIDQPNGRFEVRTDVAVVGVIGTHVYVDRQEAKTVTINLDATGRARVRNAEVSVAGEEILELFELGEVEPGRKPTKRMATLEEILSAIEATLPGPVMQLYPREARAGQCVQGVSSEPLRGDANLPFGQVSVRACAAPDVTPTRICVGTEAAPGAYEYSLAGADGLTRWGTFVVPPVPTDPLAQATLIAPAAAPPGSTVEARLVREGEPLTGIPIEISIGGQTTRVETDAQGGLLIQMPESGAAEVRAEPRVPTAGEALFHSSPHAQIVADPTLKAGEVQLPDFVQVGSRISLPGEIKTVRLGGRSLPVARTRTPSGQTLSSVQLPGDLPLGPGNLEIERPDGRTQQPALLVYDVLTARLDQRMLISGNETQGEFLVCVGSAGQKLAKRVRAQILATGPVRFRGKGAKGKVFERSFPVASNGLVRIPFLIQAEKTGTGAAIPFRLSLELGRD